VTPSALTTSILEWKSDLVLYPIGYGCPSVAPTGVPCFFQVNTTAPTDVAPVSGSVDGLRSSMTVGIGLVLFLGGWVVISRWRRRG